MVLVGLRLALGPLRLRVGGRVWLLHGHGPAQVVALPQEVRLCVQTKATLAQNHPRVVLLGARSVAGFQRGQVGSIALAQELWRGQESGQQGRGRPLGRPPTTQHHPFSATRYPGVSSFSMAPPGNWKVSSIQASPSCFGQLSTLSVPVGCSRTL